MVSLIGQVERKKKENKLSRLFIGWNPFLSFEPSHATPLLHLSRYSLSLLLTLLEQFLFSINASVDWVFIVQVWSSLFGFFPTHSFCILGIIQGLTALLSHSNRKTCVCTCINFVPNRAIGVGFIDLIFSLWKSSNLSCPKPDTRICDHDRHVNIKPKPDIKKNQLNFYKTFTKTYLFHSILVSLLKLYNFSLDIQSIYIVLPRIT